MIRQIDMIAHRRGRLSAGSVSVHQQQQVAQARSPTASASSRCGRGRNAPRMCVRMGRECRPAAGRCRSRERRCGNCRAGSRAPISTAPLPRRRSRPAAEGSGSSIRSRSPGGRAWPEPCGWWAAASRTAARPFARRRARWRGRRCAERSPNPGNLFWLARLKLSTGTRLSAGRIEDGTRPLTASWIHAWLAVTASSPLRPSKRTGVRSTSFGPSTARTCGARLSIAGHQPARISHDDQIETDPVARGGQRLVAGEALGRTRGRVADIGDAQIVERLR